MYDALSKFPAFNLPNWTSVAVKEAKPPWIRPVVASNESKKITTFFPSHWTREKVAESIHEAYDDFIARNEKPTTNKEGVSIVHGFNKEKVKIEMYITSDNIMQTAYPLLNKNEQ